MDAITILRDEHEVIRRFLETLTLARRQLEEDAHPPREYFDGLVRFARDFVDRYHHYKEELQLFMLVAQKKDGQFDPHLEALRHQHEHGRQHVQEIATAIDGYADGSPLKHSDLLEHVAAYGSMLREHIHREDHIFFPMAREVLTDEDFQRLLEVFRGEDERVGEGFVDRHRDLVAGLREMLVSPGGTP